MIIRGVTLYLLTYLLTVLTTGGHYVPCVSPPDVLYGGSQMVRFLIPKKNEWTEKEKGGFIFLCGLQTTNYVISYQGRGAPQRGGRGCGARSAPRARAERASRRARSARAPRTGYCARGARPRGPGRGAPHRAGSRERGLGADTQRHTRDKKGDGARTARPGGARARVGINTQHTRAYRVSVRSTSTSYHLCAV